MALPVKEEEDRQGNVSSDNFDDIINRNFSKNDISDMEDRASNAQLDPESPEGQESIEKQSLNRGGFYNPEPESSARVSGTSSKKKAGISIGVISVLFGGGIGLFGLLAQPLQFIQMAGMLKNFHFSTSEDQSDDRMTKISRYIKYKGDQRTRLSYLGNKYANKIETKLNKSGLKSNYNGAGSVFSGYTVDLNEVDKNKTLGDISNRSPEQIKATISEKYGISSDKISIGADGKLLISADGLNTRQTKKLLRASLTDAGYSKVGAAMRARIMGKRGLVTWSPLKKLDNKITSSVRTRIDDFKKARAERIENGTSDKILTASEKTDGNQDADGNGDPDSNPDSKAAADGVNDATSGPDAPKTNLKAKIATGGVAGIGILCAVKGLAEQYDNIKHVNVVLPLMRVGVEAMAVGDQLLTGENLDPAHLDAMTELMYDEDLQTSWRTAKSIQAEAGENLTGEDIGPEARIDADGNVFSQIVNKIPALGTICSVTSGMLGTIVDIGMSLASGGVTAIGKEFLQDFVIGKLGSGLIGWLAGEAIDVNKSGAAYGNFINYGARMASNDTMISSGGVKLTDQEVAELREIRIEEENYEFSQKSLFAKIFDARDYRTPAGKFMAEQAPDPAKNIARVASIGPKFVGNVFSPISNLLFTKTHAAENYDYGFPLYGFSNSEINSPAIENPFENDKIVADILDLNAPTISEKTERCFGIKIEKRTIGGVSAWTPISVDSVPSYVNIENNSECSDRSEDFLRIRMWIHDSQLMTATACFEDGEDGTCDDFGFNGEGSSSNQQVSAPGLNGYAIPCQGDPKEAVRLSGKGGAIDWSNIKSSGVIGSNSDGKDINVYIRNACISSNAKTIVITSSIHGSENVGQLIAHELLFNTSLPDNVRIIAIPEVNGYGVANFDRQNKNGVDLNRNFPYRWNEITESNEDDTTSEFYRGTSAGSEPETASVISFLKTIGKTDLFISYHHDLSYATSVGNTNTGVGKAYADAVELANTNSAGYSVVNQHGSMDLWYNNETSSPTVLVELKSSSYYDTIEKIKLEVNAVLAAYNAAQSQ